MLDYMVVKPTTKNIILSVVSAIIVNMIVIYLTTVLFRNIYIENIFYLFIVSTIIFIFNKSIKPIIKIIMLPLNILTLGITYPLVNMLMLKLVDIILGSKFIVSGFVSMFFISIFISIMTFIIDRLIGKEIRRV